MSRFIFSAAGCDTVICRPSCRPLSAQSISLSSLARVAGINTNRQKNKEQSWTMPSKRRSQRRVAKESAATSRASDQTKADCDKGKITKYLSSSSSSKRKQCWLTPPDQEDSEDGQVMHKRQHYQIQNQWTKITECSQITTRTLVPQPAPTTSSPLRCTESMKEEGASFYTFRNIFACDIEGRCPLPNLTWAEPSEVWNVLRAKDVKYRRVDDYKVRHKELEYHMRAILLDWIMEVCEAYRLHRETFYLASDFLDRYLSAKEGIEKHRLQLIGVTCLFIAAKIEEIYPPKIGEFADITDGACTVLDIVKQELVILKTLNWDLSPFTVNMWVCAYLTILNHSNSDKENSITLTKINYSRHSFIQIARLMDLAVLDEGCLRFCYGVIAASILYHFSDETTIYQATGYLFSEIEECVSWLAPLAVTIREANLPVFIRHFDNVLPDDMQNIQTHDVTLDLLNQAKQRQLQMSQAARSSPDPSTHTPDVLTPPPTKHKHSAAEAALYDPDLSADQSFQSSLNTLHI